ncbi:MAG: hypothetical protein ABFD54_11640 [Armatimonadota bacterium]|nr:hypothetical protein [bacterium]
MSSKTQNSQNSTNVCLVIIFNHRYEANLEKLDFIYKDRFPNVRYLMPFYDGPRKDVIGVFEDSILFEGHIAQACSSFIDSQFTHYVFAADDLILNPTINASNIIDSLCLEPGAAYIKNLTTLSDVYLWWIQVQRIFESFRFTRFNYRSQLPPAEEAEKRLKHHGLEPGYLTFNNLRHWDGNFRITDFCGYRNFARKAIHYRKPRPLPYPMAAGYSDFFIVPANIISEFCRLCGVFAAMNLWVEVAIPTALVLCCNSIKTEFVIGENWVTGSHYSKPGCWKGTELWEWTEATVQSIETNNDLYLNQLNNSFGDKELYIHPIKLSKWRM